MTERNLQEIFPIDQAFTLYAAGVLAKVGTLMMHQNIMLLQVPHLLADILLHKQFFDIMKSAYKRNVNPENLASELYAVMRSRA